MRAVAAGLTQAERIHKSAIRDGNDAAIELAARMHQLMIGLLAEAELRKIISDPRDSTTRSSGCFSRSGANSTDGCAPSSSPYGGTMTCLSTSTSTTTDDDLPNQYMAITCLLVDDLAPIIEDRNNLAHAQWRWLLNNKETKA